MYIVLNRPPLSILLNSIFGLHTYCGSALDRHTDTDTDMGTRERAIASAALT